MPVRLEKDALLAEVLAYLRAEATPRRTWLRRAWLGRRAAFVLAERVVLSRFWMSTRANDGERHAFVSALLDALEAAGALDVLSAGRWAEETLSDPVDETRPVERWQGRKAPRSTADFAADAASALNARASKRRGSRVR